MDLAQPLTLTAREQMLLDLVADGLTNRQIGRRLQISEKTVKNHLSTIFPKIGATARTQAALYAIGRAASAEPREPYGPREPRQPTEPAKPAPAEPTEPEDTAAQVELTPREWSVLDLVAGGLTNRQIARRLQISEKTVKNHLSAIFPKIGATARTQAALYAVGRGRRDEAVELAQTAAP